VPDRGCHGTTNLGTKVEQSGSSQDDPGMRCHTCGSANAARAEWCNPHAVVQLSMTHASMPVCEASQADLRSIECFGSGSVEKVGPRTDALLAESNVWTAGKQQLTPGRAARDGPRRHGADHQRALRGRSATFPAAARVVCRRGDDDRHRLAAGARTSGGRLLLGPASVGRARSGRARGRDDRDGCGATGRASCTRASASDSNRSITATTCRSSRASRRPSVMHVGSSIVCGAAVVVGLMTALLGAQATNSSAVLVLPSARDIRQILVERVCPGKARRHRCRRNRTRRPKGHFVRPVQ